MYAIALAWNERNWEDYGSLLADDLVAYASGETIPHSKQEHIERAKSFCQFFPDNIVQLKPYLELFEGENSTTCSVARISGTLKAELPIEGKVIKPNNQAFDVTFTAICKWRDGKITEQREYFDTVLMMQQLNK